jgi:hypothetical protein
MTDHPTFQKFPEGSANRDYDIFEEFSDGSTIWRACVFGMANVEVKMRELAKQSDNKFFALNLQDSRQVVVRPFRSPTREEFRRAG